MAYSFVMSAYFLFSQTGVTALALVGFSYLPIYFIYSKLIGEVALKWQLPMQKASIDEYQVLAEVLENVPTIKAFNGAKVASQSFVAQVSVMRVAFLFRPRQLP
jgi:ABC-type multidrug transport system fused ATPase/permease subunit